MMFDKFQFVEEVQSSSALHESMLDLEDLSRKGAKAQRKPFRNAAALCAFAPLREKSSRKNTFRAKRVNSEQP
jgi:hypothetical protein